MSLMASNLTPLQVINTLSNIGKLIDRGTEELTRCDAEAVEARTAYEVARANAFLSSEGPMEVRRHTADLATADLKMAMEAAEQQVRAANANLRALRDRLEIGRSLSPLLRLEWGHD